VSEEWRTIAAYPAYAVSSLGRVKRIAPTARYRVTGKVLNSKPGPSGYIMVSLYRDGQHHSQSVHSLVCEAFHGFKPSSAHQAAHGDGYSTNNRADNLSWKLPSANINDKNAHGTMPRGDRHHARVKPCGLARGERNGGGGKLTENWVRAIRADARTNRLIADDYGVSKSMIAMIKRREAWAHVD
jgi:hypothetical protein